MRLSNKPILFKSVFAVLPASFYSILAGYIQNLAIQKEYFNEFISKGDVQ